MFHAAFRYSSFAAIRYRCIGKRRYGILTVFVCRKQKRNNKRPPIIIGMILLLMFLEIMTIYVLLHGTKIVIFIGLHRASEGEGLTKKSDFPSFRTK
jgi:hypothetical protein